MKEIISVLRKHDLVKGFTPVKMRHVLEDLGPTFVKVGQLLSLRPELIPKEYCEEFKLLRTDVAPMPASEARKIVAHELGREFSEVFSEMDKKPIGSASIAQVHRARLIDGREVALKIQRPYIYKTMERDILLLRRLDKLVRRSALGKVVEFNTILDEVWDAAKQEMDFRIEAANLREFAELNHDIQYISCPGVYSNYSTARLLVMDFIHGIQIDHVEELKKAGYDLKDIGKRLVSNYIKQIIKDRFFQADPHPGNLFVSEGTIVWLDLGMMCRLSEFDAECYKEALGAVVEHDYETLKDVVLRMGVYTDPIDEVRMTDDFERFVKKYEKVPLGEVNLGKIMTEALDLATAYKIKMPRGITMVSRGVSTLEGLLEVIAPDVSVISVLAIDHSRSFLNDMDLKKESLSLLKDVVFSGRDMVKLPSQLSNTMDMLDRGKIRLRVEHMDQDKKTEAYATMFKKLTVGLLAAALILAAAIVYASGAGGSLYISIVLFVLAVLLAVGILIKK